MSTPFDDWLAQPYEYPEEDICVDCGREICMCRQFEAQMEEKRDEEIFE